MWKVKTKVDIKKVGENVLSFDFGSKAEKDNIFRGRHWFLDWAHLILKEWSHDLALKELSLDTTNITMQVHSLLPRFLHEDTAV